MLSSKIVVCDREVYPLDLVIYIDDRKVARFHFPIMGWEELQLLIAGKDVSDQNDDGFFIKQRARKVTIKIQASADCDEVYYTKFTFGYDCLVSAFKELIPHYIAAGRDKMESPVETYVLREDILEILETFDRADDSGSFHIKLIEGKKMDEEAATFVFANFMNFHPHKLTVSLVKKFVSLGVDLDKKNPYYQTKERNSNPLMMTAEFRRIDDMKALLECGASVWHDDLIHTLLEYAGDLDIMTKEDAENIIRGISLLVKNEASVVEEHIEFVKEKYTDTEFKKNILNCLEEMSE